MNLAVNGEIQEPASALGEHVNDCWPELVGPADRSLVHWLRRLVFRSAWLDQRVKEGELDVRFDDEHQTFTYVQPDRGDEPVELAPEPSWGRVSLHARAARPPERLRLAHRAALRRRAPSARFFGDRRRLARADERLDAQRVARGESSTGRRSRAAASASSAMTSSRRRPARARPR